jgi:limonene-1,2-epoxide hydrolase
MRRLLMCLTPLLLLMLVVTPVRAADDPLAVVQAFLDARNRGDFDGAAALMADETPFVGGPGCPPNNPCVGAVAHRREVEGFAALHAQVQLIAPQVSGTTVRARVEARNDLTRAAGVDRSLNDLTADVQGGKITTWRSIVDTNDLQNQALQAFQQRQATALPQTGAGSETIVDFFLPWLLLASAVVITCGWLAKIIAWRHEIRT